MKDTFVYKEKLETEKNKLERELATVGRKNPSNTKDWEAVEGDLQIDPAESAEVAEGITTFETNTAVVKELEIRLGEVNRALEKITRNTFGTCDVCKDMIEEDRLEANPAASTCKLHM